jgi:NAD-dependent deacetylase
MAELSAKTIQDIRCAAEIMRRSKHTIVLTGAGISTPSGIPDFRSTGNGLWERYDPFEVASLNAFRYHPEKFYAWMRSLALEIQNAQPNPAHLGLARLEQAGLIETIITQNIDGLHQRAGSKNVLEVHGTFQSLTCVNCYRQYPASEFMDAYLKNGDIPYCSDCHGILKPDVVLYGEQLPVRPWIKAREASKKCDLMLVAGSSLEVLPVAGLPMRAIENGAHLIIINHTETYIDVRADVVFAADVAEIIPKLAVEAIGD